MIPRADHSISRAQIDLEALKVLYRLHHQGYKAFLVGGSVRDLLLGKKPKDFDVVTDAHPGTIRRLFRNSRIIGRRFRLVQVFFRGGKVVEVSTFRQQSEFDSAEEVLAPNNTFGTPAEDARRRDLTINGLFYNIADFSVVDYVGGLDDLRQGRIRVIGPPEVRLRRDPVRMVRVLRHAARTGFVIDSEVWAEIQNQRHLIRVCAPARVRDELLKDFRSGAARQFIELMIDSGLLEAIFPAWEPDLASQPSKSQARQGWLHLFNQVDKLTQAEYPLSEAFFWAVIFTPYLDLLPFSSEAGDYRTWVQEKVMDSLSSLEFSRGRREEVCLLLATEKSLTQSLDQGSRISPKLKRRACFGEAWLLHSIKKASPRATLEELFPSQSKLQLHTKRPPRKRRRRRNARPPFRKKPGPSVKT
ncbi:MAG: poly(A) polymerase [Deltaproteobacteria bacterium]|nr:poly(A) polymerase [Deltaproteobacteria bacterium]